MFSFISGHFKGLLMSKCHRRFLFLRALKERANSSSQVLYVRGDVALLDISVVTCAAFIVFLSYHVFDTNRTDAVKPFERTTAGGCLSVFANRCDGARVYVF